MAPPQIQIFDSLTQKKHALTSASNVIKIYCCGPTVWNYTHIGNARAALSLDLVTRVIRLAGMKTEVARNYTDIEDKIINAAQKENMPWDQLAKKYTDSYEAELRELGNLEPDFKPRATETLKEMIEMIEGLIQKGMAYELKTSNAGKDVYYRVDQFKSYGKLSKRKIDDMIAGNRIAVDEKKEHPADFALWKSAKAGEPSWDSPWGAGRPGWHLECSAMIRKIFGSSGIDIHMGGIDLLFPHHENEIAQSEGFAPQDNFAKFWLHNGMLELHKEKMSKSLGNIILTRSFLEDYGPETLRVLVLQQHYRSPLDVSDENILRAEALAERLYNCKAEAMKSGADLKALNPTGEKLYNDCMQSLVDDFNSAKALGLILSEARNAFREAKSEIWKAWATSAIPLLNQVYGLAVLDPEEALQKLRLRKLRRAKLSESDLAWIEEKMAERESFRKAKDFKGADQVRAQMDAKNILIMDGPDGSSWSVKV